MPKIETDPEYVFRANQRGDQFLRISLLVDLPALPAMNKLFVGGEILGGYMRFLSSSIAIGGDISFGFNGTVGSNSLILVPMVFKFMYQPVAGKFEFPFILGVGGIFETYLDRTYFGPVFKPEAGVFFRITADWSIGLTGGCLIMPQWYKDTSYNYTGIIPDVGLAARYHF
ncbi:MAG: hypothetical protein LBS97_01190 [Treponema sp.]|nr:hypothetical protein [Treponema sp.]